MRRCSSRTTGTGRRKNSSRSCSLAVGRPAVGALTMRIPAASPDASYAALVFDDDGGELRRFRSTTELPAADLDDTRELTELRCSGSAQPSVAGFRELEGRLAGVRDEELCVVDLRQESHGFVNGAAVSWYATNNWGCAGLSDDEALALEALRLR